MSGKVIIIISVLDMRILVALKIPNISELVFPIAIY